LKKVELCAPAGNLPSLKAAVDQGADAVYLGFNSPTNLRNFPGLNLTKDEVGEGIDYAHARGRRVYLTINSYPQKDELAPAYQAVDEAWALKADGLILSDLGLLSYVHEKYPMMRIHLSVQAGASNSQSIAFYQENFAIKRVILPRVLSLKEIAQLRKETEVELEVFGLGLLCINYEGRCFLSSYLTGESINTYGACAPPRFVKFQKDENLRIALGGIWINEYPKGTAVAYPTPCKGHYHNSASGKFGHVFQNPQSLNVLEIIPLLIDLGIDAVKIEGRQRSRVYVQKVVSQYRRAIDQYYRDAQSFKIKKEWQSELARFFEGMSFTCGCYVEK